MDISEFDYELPEDLIARELVHPRDASRMMVLDSKRGNISHAKFIDLPQLLSAGDVLVLNDTKVIRARTVARLDRKSGTSRPMEVFFAEPLDDREIHWQVLCKPGRRIRAGDRAVFGNGELSGVFLENMGADLHVLEFESRDSIAQILRQFGEIPLPPYINRKETQEDKDNYQTIYAAHSGAVAAPTAGLHFTPEVLSAIRSCGVEIVNITLHVGIGTFLPVRTEVVEEHLLRPERFEITEAVADRLQAARHDRRRIVAVGTTTTRTLEFLMREHGEIRAGAGRTDLYILPGFQFQIVGALLTNFHLPRSTLFMLVSAFAGRNVIRDAYRQAIEARYRFYSYGDCMFIQR